MDPHPKASRLPLRLTRPTRSASRSTVGTMTEVNDHLKRCLRALRRCISWGCGQPVRRDTPDSTHVDLKLRAAKADDPRLAIPPSGDGCPWRTSKEAEVEQFSPKATGAQWRDAARGAGPHAHWQRRQSRVLMEVLAALARQRAVNEHA